MALVDAGFRAGLSDSDCNRLLKALAPVTVRISPPDRMVVTNTFVKVRQEPKTPTDEEPYGSSIAYRELAYHKGVWLWAFDVAGGSELADWIELLAPHISYIGKRGSFIQFCGLTRMAELSTAFTQPLAEGQSWSLSSQAQVLVLDDFGPEADLETLSSFTKKRAARDRHRRFVETIVPLRSTSTGAGFSEYEVTNL
ncbi:MAG: hypothetical protein ACYDAG_17300 [Chloroflexota bacterium]